MLFGKRWSSKDWNKLSGVSEVVDEARVKNGGGHMTTYAIRKDGSFYDLCTILNLGTNYKVKHVGE